MIKSILVAFVISIFQFTWAATIVGSKHDLSVTNEYGFFAGATTEVCIFCHTPHGSNDGVGGPIWNRRITDQSQFTMYTGTAGTPNNASIVCLSCHDGVSAQGDDSAVAVYDQHNVVNNPGSGHETNMATPNCYACHFSGDMYPQVNWRIGPDLTDDHPVSVSYASAKASRPLLKLVDDPTLVGIKLFSGMVECASCHSVHDKTNRPFLRKPNDGSGLCKSCHSK